MDYTLQQRAYVFLPLPFLTADATLTPLTCTGCESDDDLLHGDHVKIDLSLFSPNLLFPLIFPLRSCLPFLEAPFGAIEVGCPDSVSSRYLGFEDLDYLFPLACRPSLLPPHIEKILKRFFFFFARCLMFFSWLFCV